MYDRASEPLEQNTFGFTSPFPSAAPYEELSSPEARAMGNQPKIPFMQPCSLTANASKKRKLSKNDWRWEAFVGNSDVPETFDSVSLQVALDHLALASPEALAPIISTLTEADRSALVHRSSLFWACCDKVIESRITVAAATSTKSRLRALLNENDAAPACLLKVPGDVLKKKVADGGVGLGGQKAGYLLSLAEYFATGRDPGLSQLSDYDFMKSSFGAEVKGVGPLALQVLLIRALGRRDVLPVGDHLIFGFLKKAAPVGLIQSNSFEELNAGSIATLTASWRPYRSIAAQLIWLQRGAIAKK